MKDFQLYVIIDEEVARGLGRVEEIASQAIAGGAEVIQLRGKTLTTRELLKISHSLKVLAHNNNVLFIVNDRVDVAWACDADGVHLGQDDFPISNARAIVGKGKIIGISAHSLTDALQAEREGADYIAIGPVFATLTKPHFSPVGLSLVRKAKERLHVPFLAVGGIDQTNIRKVIKAGAKRVAITRAVVEAKDVAKATKELKEILEA